MTKLHTASDSKVGYNDIYHSVQQRIDLNVSNRIQSSGMLEIDVEIYETASGKRPFEEWVEGLREGHTQAKVWTRIDRLKMGNFGDCKSKGVS